MKREINKKREMNEKREMNRKREWDLKNDMKLANEKMQEIDEILQDAFEQLKANSGRFPVVISFESSAFYRDNFFDNHHLGEEDRRNEIISVLNEEIKYAGLEAVTKTFRPSELYDEREIWEISIHKK